MPNKQLLPLQPFLLSADFSSALNSYLEDIRSSYELFYLNQTGKLQSKLDPSTYAHWLESNDLKLKALQDFLSTLNLNLQTLKAWQEAAHTTKGGGAA